MPPTLTDLFHDDSTFEEWQAHLADIGEPDIDLDIPEGDAYADVLRFMAVPEEDIPDIVATRDAVASNPEVLKAIRGTAFSLSQRMGEIWMPPPFPSLKDFNDPIYRFIWIHMFSMLLPHARAYHQEKGIPDDISKATMGDLGRNVRVHRKREGVAGLGVAWWLRLHFRGLIYDLGRLQFERVKVGNEEMMNAINEAGGDVTTETPVLSVHIPDFSGPMTPEACDAAIQNAREFFPTYFPETRTDVLVCHSWLLDPALKNYLRPDSNIIQLQNRFTLTDRGWDSTEGVMQFVFGRKEQDIDTVPQDTSLARGVVKHIRDGNRWYGKSGFAILDQG